MAKTTAKVLGLALVGAGAYGLWTLGHGLWGDDEAAGTRHVVNQVWIERAPEGPRDMIAHLVLLDTEEMRIGGAGKSSQWRHLIELFQWGLEGNRLSIFFPQDRVKAQVSVRSWSCKGEAPEPFELCLEISNGRRKAVFYSLEEWHIDPDHAEASLAELQQAYPELGSLGQAVVMPMDAGDDDRDGYAEIDATHLLAGQ
jgi:hypothetical protein